VKAPAQKEKELSLTCGGTISNVQSYLVTVKEAEKDKDEGGKQFLFLYAGEGSIFRPFADFRPGLPASDRCLESKKGLKIDPSLLLYRRVLVSGSWGFFSYPEGIDIGYFFKSYIPVWYWYQVQRRIFPGYVARINLVLALV
jgi:hypothetical protein